METTSAGRLFKIERQCVIGSQGDVDGFGDRPSDSCGYAVTIFLGLHAIFDPRAIERKCLRRCGFLLRKTRLFVNCVGCVGDDGFVVEGFL